ncbi:MAG: DUF1648 domain-containing protein [Candidatus Kurthia intestinigallinarum]|uniref:DUF1648 domain-containing protein n=1 Tax=Kurthia sp. Dielmo TaxID=1033738 RepID=UPI0011234A1E|nr:DUF1648 domain-containing protein [Kurthia sp. Dielmo]
MRPKIKLEKSIPEKIANSIGYAAILFLIIFFFAKMSTLPAEIPMHYNGVTVDRYGSKWETIALILIAIATQIGLEFLERKPQLHNYPARFNEENAEAFYRASSQILNYTKNTIAVLMAFIMYEILTLQEQLSPLFWILIALVIGLSIWGVMKMSRIGK